MSNPFEKLAALRDQLPPGPAPSAQVKKSGPDPLAGKLVVRHERKGRAGRTVTLVQGVALKTEALEEFARDMKKALGCGATLEDGDIVLQGDIVDRVVAYLEKKGAARVVRGTG
jgi:translation initiation factor 1